MSDTLMAGRRRADQRPSLISRSASVTPQRRADAPRAIAIPQVFPELLSPLVLAGTAVLLTVILMVLTR